MQRRSLALIAVVLSTTQLAAQAAPLADHHQHLFSPAIEQLLASPSGGPKTITARDVIAVLDSAGIRRGVVLSVAYMFGRPNRNV
ncbi:MAG TPA: hypothetical protein VE861_10835 [Gemmatimonadaceae bacterium]|nr:hypothetical protein [Gemmatimonadaceae bacterium]